MVVHPGAEVAVGHVDHQELAAVLVADELGAAAPDEPGQGVALLLRLQLSQDGLPGFACGGVGLSGGRL